MSYYSEDFHEPIKSARIRVRIWGLDSAGQTFNESVSTSYVGRKRAAIEGVKAHLKVGDVIGVGHGDLKARFRVDATDTNASGESLAELHMIAPAKGNFWGVDLDSVPPTLSGRERRVSPRYRCAGFATLYVADQKFVVRAPVTDIALNGCYIELSMPYAVGCRFRLEVTVRDAYIACAAHVVSSHPGVGMGVRFDTDRLIGAERLRRLLAELDRELIPRQPS